jgi:hypothetical protein
VDMPAFSTRTRPFPALSSETALPTSKVTVPTSGSASAARARGSYRSCRPCPSCRRVRRPCRNRASPRIFVNEIFAADKSAPASSPSRSLSPLAKHQHARRSCPYRWEAPTVPLTF